MNHPQDGTHEAQLQSEDYRRLAELLREWTGIRLHGKQHLMSGRLRPLLRGLGVQRYRDYHTLLAQAGPRSAEAEAFINALTTNKTSFFRESHHFEFLVRDVFAAVQKRVEHGGPQRLRLYSAGCSRGAEPYSMAMLAAFHLPSAHGWDVKILATDLDTHMLAEAKKGVYDAEDVAQIPPDLRQRFCRRVGPDSFQVVPEITRLVTFAQANLIAHPFPVRGTFDAVFCRNVMIYFDQPTQEALVEQLLRLLVPGGIIAVGHAEALMRTDLERANVPGAYRRGGGQTQVDASAAGRAPTQAPTSPPPGTPASAVWHSPRHMPPARPRPSHGSAPRVLGPSTPRTRPGPAASMPIRRITLGECAIGTTPMRIGTLLGSCVAACLYDPVAGVGGMNHFMLPSASSSDGSARFGVHAMEMLINQLMRHGADRNRLRAKAFGAAAVNRILTSTVAAKNESFIREFLATEGIPLVAERLGGVTPREVILCTHSGEVQVRAVENAKAATLERAEADAHAHAAEQAPSFNPDDVLF